MTTCDVEQVILDAARRVMRGAPVKHLLRHESRRTTIMNPGQAPTGCRRML